MLFVSNYNHLYLKYMYFSIRLILIEIQPIKKSERNIQYKSMLFVIYNFLLIYSPESFLFFCNLLKKISEWSFTNPIWFHYKQSLLKANVPLCSYSTYPRSDMTGGAYNCCAAAAYTIHKMHRTIYHIHTDGVFFVRTPPAIRIISTCTHMALSVAIAHGLSRFARCGVKYMGI